MSPTQNSPTNGGGSGNKTSHRRVAANRANAQKSTGPRTGPGLDRVARNLPAASATRLLGLAESRVLKQEPGAAELLYRKLIAPYGPRVPTLLALHFQDLARLQLELQALERIRDAQLEHRAQQTAIGVRRLYREMDRELGIAPKEVFQQGLYSIADSPAKFRMQFDALIVLRAQLQRGDFAAMATPLRQLYGSAFEPAYERAQLICSDRQRLMDPKSEALSEQDMKILLGLVEREIEDAMEGYELELDERTKTVEARLSDLAPSRQDQWINMQVDRLRRGIDRNKRLLPKLLQNLSLAEAPPPGAAEVGEAGQEKKIT